jgi:hypothetical protein
MKCSCGSTQIFGGARDPFKRPPIFCVHMSKMCTKCLSQFTAQILLPGATSACICRRMDAYSNHTSPGSMQHFVGAPFYHFQSCFAISIGPSEALFSQALMQLTHACAGFQSSILLAASVFDILIFNADELLLLYS